MAVPQMLKQWSSVIDGVTTIVCLDAAGQIREVDELFETLNGEFWHPPAHIHCRAIVVPWMAGFINTQRRPANAELARRPRKQRRKGPGGSTASNPPPDRSNPPGRRPPVAPVTPAARRRAERDAPSFEVENVDDWDDVRRSDGMREVLADPDVFRPTTAGGDPIAGEIARQRGMDGLPQRVKDLASVAAFVVSWRLAGQQRRAQILLRFTDYLDRFMNGVYRAGLGVFGAGIVFWMLGDGEDESLLPVAGAERVEARLDPDARVIDLEDLRRLQAEALARLDEEPATAERERWRRVISDEGRYAMLLGYQAIRVLHADGSVEIVVLDRGALIVEEP